MAYELLPCKVSARFFTRPPDNLGTQRSFLLARSNPIAPGVPNTSTLCRLHCTAGPLQHRQIAASQRSKGVLIRQCHLSNRRLPAASKTPVASSARFSRTPESTDSALLDSKTRHSLPAALSSSPSVLSRPGTAANLAPFTAGSFKPAALAEVRSAVAGPKPAPSGPYPKLQDLQPLQAEDGQTRTPSQKQQQSPDPSPPPPIVKRRSGLCRNRLRPASLPSKPQGNAQS